MFSHCYPNASERLHCYTTVTMWYHWTESLCIAMFAFIANVNVTCISTCSTKQNKSHLKWLPASSTAWHLAVKQATIPVEKCIPPWRRYAINLLVFSANEPTKVRSICKLYSLHWNLSDKFHKMCRYFKSSKGLFHLKHILPLQYTDLGSCTEGVHCLHGIAQSSQLGYQMISIVIMMGNRY